MLKKENKEKKKDRNSGKLSKKKPIKISPKKDTLSKNTKKSITMGKKIKATKSTSRR